MNEEKDIFEKAFGKAPEKGYEFHNVNVELIDNNGYKGFNIQWSAKGIGFGELFYGWGLQEDSKKYGQYGFHSDTEIMGPQFVAALMDESMPQIVDLIIKHNRSPNEK